MSKEKEKETQQTKIISNVIKKITSRAVLGEIKAPDKETMLYTLIGNIYGYTIGKSAYSEFIKFKGDFVAVLKDGTKEFRSPYALVPAPMDMALAGSFDRAVEAAIDNETGEVSTKRIMCEVAIEIGLKPSDIPIGYEWVMRPLIDIAPTNALESLKQKVLSDQS